MTLMITMLLSALAIICAVLVGFGVRYVFMLYTTSKHGPLGGRVPDMPTRPDPPPPMPPFTYTQPSWEKPQFTIETVEGSLTWWHPRQVSACIFPTDYENCQNRMTDGKCTSFVCTKIVRFRSDKL